MNSNFVGCFGKLPASGDFVARGLPQNVMHAVYEWFVNGMSELERREPQEWRHAYLVTPVWHFVINAGVWVEPALQGCLAPSLDKVGRYSPLMVVRSFENAVVSDILPPEDDWLYRVDDKIRRAINDCLAPEILMDGIDIVFSRSTMLKQARSTASILSTLGIVDDSTESHKRWFSWPDLHKSFVERRHRSFWWAEPSPRQPPRQVIHSGLPDNDLFCLLLGGNLFGDKK